MTMTNNGLLKRLRCYGPDHVLCYVRWAPSSDSTQTLTEAQGVTGVTRSGAGAYTIAFSRIPKAIIPISHEVVENDTTTYHFARVESTSVSAGTATVSHKSVAFASVASGPSGSDTVDELCFAFLLRMGS